MGFVISVTVVGVGVSVVVVGVFLVVVCVSDVVFSVIVGVDVSVIKKKN